MIKNKINEKIYIGQTVRSIKIRFHEHRTKSSGCVAIYNAIKIHGWENFEKDYYECPDEDLNFDEELLVREMGTLSSDGYNLMEGGGANGKRSEETKQKMSEANLGKKDSDKTKQKKREAQLGKTHTEETKQKNREAHLGEKNPTSKRVYQYALDGTYIASFGSSGEAGRHLGKSGSNIRACARKKNIAYGFKWSYVKD